MAVNDPNEPSWDDDNQIWVVQNSETGRNPTRRLTYQGKQPKFKLVRECKAGANIDPVNRVVKDVGIMFIDEQLGFRIETPGSLKGLIYQLQEYYDSWVDSRALTGVGGR